MVLNMKNCIPGQHQNIIDSDPSLRDMDPGMHGSPSLENSGLQQRVERGGGLREAVQSELREVVGSGRQCRES